MWPQWPKLACGELFWSRVYRLNDPASFVYFGENLGYEFRRHLTPAFPPAQIWAFCAFERRFHTTETS